MNGLELLKNIKKAETQKTEQQKAVVEKANKQVKKIVRAAKKVQINNDAVQVVEFYQDQIDALERCSAQTEDLYDDLYKIFKDRTSGDYQPHLKDLSALATTLVSTRVACADIVQKEIQAKKILTDIAYRSGGGGAKDDAEIAQQTARELMRMLNNEYRDKKNSKSAPKELPTPHDESKVEEVLEERVKSGRIKMSRNDNLVGTNDYIVTRYDPKSEGFVAVDSRDGSIIDNFPKDRLPAGKVTKVNKNDVSMEDGSTVPVYDNMEFDDNYVDNGK